MILVDFNQVVIANVAQHLAVEKGARLSEDLIRHMSLNTLRANAKKFKMKYGKTVVCCDAKTVWRKDHFPFYKAHRRHDRAASPLDWGLVFSSLETMREEIRENFPYKVVLVEGAEADDIIATLAIKYSPHEEVLVVSSDKDFGQLQKYKNVSQYSPHLKRFIQADDPDRFLKEHIIRGDRGDGVPNFLSPDNTFVTGERQKSINSKKLLEWMELSTDAICTTDAMRRGWERNKLMIDLSCIPENIQTKIIEAYDEAEAQPRSKLLTYLMAKRLKLLMESINDF